MKSILIGILIMCCIPVVAQTAQVIELSPAEGKQAMDLYAQKTAIEKKIEDFRQTIQNKYVSEKVPSDGFVVCAGVTNGYLTCPPPDTTIIPKNGWEYGFQFSDDFRFIVPKTSPPNSAVHDKFPNNCTVAW